MRNHSAGPGAVLINSPDAEQHDGKGRTHSRKTHACVATRISRAAGHPERWSGSLEACGLGCRRTFGGRDEDRHLRRRLGIGHSVDLVRDASPHNDPRHTQAHYGDCCQHIFPSCLRGRDVTVHIAAPWATASSGAMCDSHDVYTLWRRQHRGEQQNVLANAQWCVGVTRAQETAD